MTSFCNKAGLLVLVAAIAFQATVSYAFITPHRAVIEPSKNCMRKLTTYSPLFMAENEAENQVLELADDETEGEQASESNNDGAKAVEAAAAPFLSQGDIDEEALTMDWSDPKQQRVMIYIILSLLPVLFLIPLMLGSRDLIPQDMLPPVELN